MAKKCKNCGNKIGLLDQKLKFKDRSYICGNCIKKYRLPRSQNSDAPTMTAIKWASNNTFDDFKKFKNSGIPFDELTKNTDNKSDSDLSSNPQVLKAAKKIRSLNIPEEIKEQLIKAKVFDFWFNNKELKALPEILDYKNGEIIKYTASGLKEESGKTRTVLIICTNKRVIFLNKNMFFGGDSTDIPLNMINSVQLSTHLILADIAITNGANTVILNQLDKEAARILAKTIKQESLKFQQKLLQPTSATIKTTDPADEIRKFKKLADDGIITQDEFEAKKKQLLGL